MPDIDLYSMKIENEQILTSKGISFHILTEKEYEDIYYDQMFKADWSPIANSMSAHYLLAKGSIYALKKDKEIIATLSASKSPGYGVAYMGFFIVDERWRGKGVGERLWEIVASQLSKEGYKIEFDAPNELVPYYNRLGYKAVTTMTIHALKDKNKLQLQQRFLENHPNIEKISESNFHQVIQYDYSILPNDTRAEFLRKWVLKQDSLGFCYMEKSNIKGYGVISKYRQKDGSTFGYLIAPVFADNSEIAKSLIISLSTTANKGEPIHLDTLNITSTRKSEVSSIGFETLVEVKRMSETGKLEGENRSKNLERVFALSSHAYSPF